MKTKEEIIAEAKFRYPSGTFIHTLGNSLLKANDPANSGIINWEEMSKYSYESPLFSTEGLHLGLQKDRGGRRVYVYNSVKDIWAQGIQPAFEQELKQIRKWLDHDI